MSSDISLPILNVKYQSLCLSLPSVIFFFFLYPPLLSTVRLHPKIFIIGMGTKYPCIALASLSTRSKQCFFIVKGWESKGGGVCPVNVEHRDLSYEYNNEILKSQNPCR